MAERSAYLEGGNLALVITVCALWLAAGLLVFGPGRIAIARAGGDAQEKAEREVGWQERHSTTGPISEQERAEWSRRYARLRELGAPLADEPALMAWVAGRLGARSVRGLEVTRSRAADDETPQAVELREPFGEGRLNLVPVPVRVRFDARYADLAGILARLEPGASALTLRQIELRRQYPDVRVELELELWTREAQDS